VNRSSGSATRLPTTVMGVSPAAIVALPVLAELMDELA
jgi:hypothetical protein